MAVELIRVAFGLRDVMGEQLDAAVTVADGAVSSALTGGLYKVRATSDCTIRIGPSLSDATGGETWKADEKEPRMIAHGSVVAVDAP